MEDAFWTHDTSLFTGTFHYFRDKKQPVRGKVHVSGERYDLSGFGHSLERSALKAARGERTYLLMHPYVAVPDVTMTVGLYRKPKQYADEGEHRGERGPGAGLVDIDAADASGAEL